VTRLGFVAEAAIEVLADRLSCELPGLEQAEIRRIASAQAEELRAVGWRITAPVSVIGSASRRRKADRT
jgi:hypothetical protein